MKKIVSGLIIGLVAGSAATYLLVSTVTIGPHKSIFSQPKSIRHIPRMSVEAAETYRKGAYTEIQTIEDTLALPTDFSQTEALYTLAGRSDARAVQELIYEANQIADLSDRRAGLQILFSRLTELDPLSALALSQTREYSSNKQLEAMVWVEWGKNDIHNALIAASELAPDSRRSLAAQALYSAYGAGGNETIALIEDALHIPPSKNTKAQYLYSLAAQSPAEAVAYIESQDSRDEQNTLTYWLASFLGRTNPGNAQQYADLFSNPQNRNTYVSSVTAAASETSPETVLEQALSSYDQRQRMQAAVVLSQLAARDPDKAIAYVGEARNDMERRMFTAAIAQGLAQVDPDRAIQWALEIDTGGELQLYAAVLATISQQNPRRALDAAVAVQNPNIRRRALQGVFMSVANNDPVLAVSYLEQIQGDEIEESVTQSILASWSRSDPGAAIEWALSRNKDDRRRLLGGVVGPILINQDTQAAINLLPRLDEEIARQWRLQIASTLASQSSPAQAQSFIAQYKGHDDYPQMYAAAVQHMASTDFPAALQMAHSLQGGIEKDQLLRELAQQRADVSPEESVSLLDQISDEAVRHSATTQLVQQWGRRDSEAAAAWARNLPHGQKRDAAIVGLTMGWREITPSRKLLLESIGDVHQRRQAQTAVIYRLARTDRDAANRQLLEFDFPDAEREQLEAMMERLSNESVGIIFD